MGEIGVLALRGLAGGALVVVFALIGEVVTPKAFSGPERT
jgi:ABC-type spermidine/putrescine transport system permease subunit I